MLITLIKIVTDVEIKEMFWTSAFSTVVLLTQGDFLVPSF